MPKQKQKKVFNIELEHKVAASSFIGVEASDSNDAFIKVMAMIKGKKIKGAHMYDNKRRDVKKVSGIKDISFDYPEHADPHKIKIVHVQQE